MYVVVDIEWAENRRGFQSLTQIAATKVDSDWNFVASFFSLIRPQNVSFENFNQVCYNGAPPHRFQAAQTAFTVLKEFEEWLNADDILLFWYDTSHHCFSRLNSIIFKTPYSRPCVALSEYVTALIGRKQTKKANPYKLASSNGIKVPLIPHVSTNDVSVVLSLLRKVSLDQALLLAPPPKREKQKKPAGRPSAPYLYDETDRLLHKGSCPGIPEGHDMTPYTALRPCFRKGYKPCPLCLAEDYRKARIEQNIDSLNRSQYTYAYLKTSKVFHRPSCRLLLNAREVILGAVKFGTVAETGRVPCRICKPSENDLPKQIELRQSRINTNRLKRKSETCTPEEKRAIGRYRRAKQEREIALKNAAALTEQQRRDLFTLTQPELAFWAARGYRTFHIRTCAKLTSMSHYRGFKSYDQALRAGYVPCRTCKPSPKHDTLISIPLANELRENDGVEALLSLCEKEGYSHTKEDALLTIETPVGIWRIHTQAVPVKVEHNNLIVGNGHYHPQPRIFLSLLDTFFYIDRHDKTLIKKLSRAGGD